MGMWHGHATPCLAQLVPHARVLLVLPNQNVGRVWLGSAEWHNCANIVSLLSFFSGCI